MFFVLLRPIFCEKWKIAPPIRKEPPSYVWTCEIGRKIALNFGEDLFFFFFGDHLILGGKNFEFPIFPRHFISNFGQIVWNWFKVNENSSQGRLHTSHSFKIAPPLFQILATRLPTTGCFHNKTKSLMANLQMDCYLLLKYCRRRNLSYLRLPGQITYRVKVKPSARF